MIRTRTSLGGLRYSFHHTVPRESKEATVVDVKGKRGTGRVNVRSWVSKVLQTMVGILVCILARTRRTVSIFPAVLRPEEIKGLKLLLPSSY